MSSLEVSLSATVHIPLFIPLYIMAQRRSSRQSERQLSIGDLTTVRKVVHPARTKWYDIGLELELPVDTLDAIERSRGDDGDHLRAILKLWLKRAAPTPTSKALVDALMSSPVGESRLACDVEGKLHSLSNSCSIDKSMLRQYNFPSWIKVILCILIFLFILPVVLTFYHWVMYRMNLLHSKSLPFHDHKIFVGRELNKRQIIQEIHKPHPPIISIVGPPGFGKSTLAIHIGHAMVADGMLVNYVDMSAVSSKQTLAEKILAGDSGIVAIKSVTVERLYVWARGLNERTLLILDNCDIILHNTTDLQTIVEKLLESSPRLKIIITSRKKVLQLNQFTYQLKNLSSEASCDLLQRVTYHEGLNLTTCKCIASLTGNVPLALQIVGAILNDANSPDAMTIVDKLERDLISTLSPEELPVEERVNASINLSYQYLTRQLQKFGRYVANFPGSFDQEAACDIVISITNNRITCSKIAKYLEDLVRRSLLEFDSQRNRYQFHTLIREFFLAVSKKATGENETNQFLIHFQAFYTTVLQNLTKQFNNNYVQALPKLDMERHNILHVLEYLGDPSTKIDINDTSDLHAVGSIQFSLGSRFLNCRFTSRELLGPISSIVRRLSQKANLLLKRPDPFLHYFKFHVVMIIHLADLENEVNGASNAVQVFTAGKYIVDNMEQEQSAEVSDTITLFYQELSHYYSLLEEHDKVKECHEKVLRLTRNLLAKCEPGKCQYYDIGRAYYDIGDYASSAHFFQLALDLEGENLTEMVTVNSMALLYLSYYNVHDTVEAENVLENLTALLPVVKAKPETEAYRSITVLKTLIEIYQLNRKFEEARLLKDKLIKAVRRIGAKPTESTMRAALELAAFFYKANDYAEAADLAEFALQSFTHLNKSQFQWELAEIQFTFGMAKFMNWNFLEGLPYIKLYMCNIISRTNPSFTDWQIPFYFAFCGDVCPFQNTIHCKTNILQYGVRIIGSLLFDTLLDMNTVEKYLVQKSNVKNQALSHPTKLVVAKEDIDHSLLLSVPHSIALHLLIHVTSVFKSAFLMSVDIWLNTCIFIINVTYIMEKLVLISSLAYIVWWCIASIVNYCRVFNFLRWCIASIVDYCRVFMYAVILYAIYRCYPLNFIKHVPSSTFIPWLFLSMCACLSFITLMQLKSNTSLCIVALTSFYPLRTCINKTMHYCKVIVHLCDSILLYLNFAIWSIVLSIVGVSTFLLLGGIACGIFELNDDLYAVLVRKIIFTVTLSLIFWKLHFAIIPSFFGVL